MSARFAATMLTEFGAVIQEAEADRASRSGAAVRRVRTDSDLDAYFKVVPATSGPDAMAAARRELAFYRELAPTAPISTPALLNSAETANGVAMLLVAAGEPRPAGSWTPEMWARLGEDLAALHSMPLPVSTTWSRPDRLRQAIAQPDLPTIEAFWGPVLPSLAQVISRRNELERMMDALPTVFIHGDCHTDNITSTGRSLVFLDWQVSGFGRPGSDLAFLNVRALPAGVSAPPELIDSYLAVRPGKREELELAVLAEEIAIFVFQWPPFAAYNSPSGIDRVQRRTRALCDRWFDAFAAPAGR